MNMAPPAAGSVAAAAALHAVFSACSSLYSPSQFGLRARSPSFLRRAEGAERPSAKIPIKKLKLS